MVTGPVACKSSHVAICRLPTTVIWRTFLGSSQLAWMLANTLSGYFIETNTTSSMPGCTKEAPVADTTSGSLSSIQLKIEMSWLHKSYAALTSLRIGPRLVREAER